ncbi:2-hydroxymuconic semialdehyde dehydrogenase [Rhodotorula toruloides ATCC 204091]|nr:2-hydroxymuconic semialdehyde dehydrogenase [Rhodotorula toruloides ATCC 204091]
MAVTGGFRSAAGEAQEIEAGLLPVHLQLQNQLFRLALRALAAPFLHPLHARTIAARRRPAHASYRSPLDLGRCSTSPSPTLSSRPTSPSKRSTPTRSRLGPPIPPLRLNNFAVTSIIISCSHSVIHHVAACDHVAHDYWIPPCDAFAPTDAQGALRLLSRFWSLSLPAASPEAFDTFAQEYKATLLALKTADVDLEMVYSSHLLAALPSSLATLQTTIAVSNRSSLPSTDSILELPAPSAPRAPRPPPSPCPACQANHWLRECPRKAEYRRQQDKQRASANLAVNPGQDVKPPSASASYAQVAADGIEAWLGSTSYFSSLRACCPEAVGGIAGSNSLKATGVGTITVRLDSGKVLTIGDVLFVEGISATLLSTSVLYRRSGISTTFGDKATVARGNKVAATGTQVKDGLYILDGTLITPLTTTGACALLASAGSSAPLTVWHQRLAHLSWWAITALAKSQSVSGLVLKEVEGSPPASPCNVCHASRASRLPFLDLASHATEPLELVHSDVLSIDTPSIGGRRYVVTFVDDYSRMLWVEPLAHKSDVLEAFKRFKAAAEAEAGKPLRRFRSDNGGEYIGKAFQAFLAEHGIKHKPTTPHSPQSNGVAERVNQSIIEGVLSMLTQAGAPKMLWAEALLAFTFIKNRSPHSALGGDVPLKLWRGKPARLDMVRTWGCRAWHTVTAKRGKLDAKAVPLVFVGYDSGSAAYRLYDPIARRTIRSRDVRFVEDDFPLRAPAAAGTVNSTPIEPGLVITSETSPVVQAEPDKPASPSPSPPPAPQRQRVVNVQPVTPPRQPVFERSPAPASQSPDEIDFLSDPLSSTLAEVGDIEALIAAAGDTGTDDPFELPTTDPRNHKEALRDKDSGKWVQGELDEFSSLQDEYKVFHAIDAASMPKDAKVIGCRFVYRRKKDAHGRVTGHKVRLVAQGFSQRPGVDFRETFAPVAKFTSIRVLLALAARHRYRVQQADVDKAYLHGQLEESLYMCVPEGIAGPDWTGKVLKLDRALYGLKQAGRVWNHRIHDSLAQLGYRRSTSDACIYMQNEGGQQRLTASRGGLKREYGIKDLGDAQFILGIQILRRPDGSLFLSQRAYLQDVLQRFNMSDCRPSPTPMVPNQQLVAAPAVHAPSPELRRRYLQAVGSLMYAMLGTRPDLAFAVGLLGRFARNPDDAHWAAVERVLRYIEGTLDHGLQYRPEDSSITGFEAYSDSDWGADVNTSRSTMGYVFLLAGGAVSWSSRIQPRFHNRTRHLRLTEHLVCETVKQGLIRVEYIPTACMVANIFTKSLPLPAFSAHRDSLGVRALVARGGVGVIAPAHPH